MRVLIALDDSPVSARAARVAARLFHRVPGVEFLVINVATIPTAWVGGAGYGAVAPLVVDPRWLVTAVEDNAEDERELMAEAVAAGVPEPQVERRVGDPVSEICAAAADLRADLIVVGSHDKSALRRLFDPSVAAGIIRETALPVLVVSGDEAAAP